MLKFELLGEEFIIDGNDIKYLGRNASKKMVSGIMELFYMIITGPEDGPKDMFFFNEKIEPVGGKIIEYKIDNSLAGAVY